MELVGNINKIIGDFDERTIAARFLHSPETYSVSYRLKRLYQKDLQANQIFLSKNFSLGKTSKIHNLINIC